MFFEYSTNEKNINECFRLSREWLESHSETKKMLVDYFRGFEEVQYVIPLEAEINAGKPWGSCPEPFPFIPPWLHVFHESDQELDSVVTTALCGLYKDSLRGIRSLVELNLLGFYFFTKQDYGEFKSWLDGDTETPKRVLLMNYLNQNNANIAALEKIGWQKKVGALYKELSAFIHTSGKKGSFSTLRVSNTIIFSEQAISYIVDCLIKTIKLMTIGRIAMFPMALQPIDVVRKFGFNGPIMGWLDEPQVEQITKIFADSPNDLEFLRKLSANDPDTQSRVEAVNQTKDLTDVELLEGLQKYIDNLKPEERKSFEESVKDKTLGYVAAIIGARNKAFMRVVIPVLNEHFLGIIEK